MAKIERAHHVLDATGQAPGRLASQIAHLLIGKHKVTFLPNVDAGDSVEVVNASKVKISGQKLEQKAYYHHTGAPGGLRTKMLSTAMVEDPTQVITRAVSRMLPKNSHRTPRLKRLTVKA
ncbi:50S ribosomal protein L13 [Candidatus Uhrbacteria bacterium RIFCSPHIGHO2_01_FULL_63_20]|uniref:Large ribosomal subunit protein uL13 n=1 Tax=Candidatus Uhrbacteria bacterium RIFCSPHIGHO2_01_FULL_63_20 TaxID=1802385 RepID=A0A1F7TKJ1_9BACT|nr:MAG: 50S ribosomal protein L13 [Candidatus Uhrbacteria bacterium RIFCSPHIGHO2_01_FULL_63_20]